mgnify:CR=1 FL=1
MRKIRNFLCFFICSFHLNCQTTEEQITDRQVLLRVTQKVSSYSKPFKLLLKEQTNFPPKSVNFTDNNFNLSK